MVESEANTYKVVLAVSQDPAKMSGPDRPRTEFSLLAQEMGAVLVGNTGHSERNALLNRFEKATALDIGQAIHILRNHPDADIYVSFSERIGIPLASMLHRRKSRPKHIMIAHRLDTKAKRALAALSRWPDGIDKIITLCGAQQHHGRVFLADKSKLILAGLSDDRFYCPAEDNKDGGYVLSVGSENRDYETLISAIERTDLRLKILSSSPWCRKKRADLNRTNGQVEFLPRVDYSQLRELYQRARIVVVPLHDVPYAAGLNGVLEAFCANKPLIVSSSRGITDYVSHLNNAYIVPVGNVNLMVAALTSISSDGTLMAQLKLGTLQAVREYANLRAYTATLMSEIISTIEER